MFVIPGGYLLTSTIERAVEKETEFVSAATRSVNWRQCRPDIAELPDFVRVAPGKLLKTRNCRVGPQRAFAVAFVANATVPGAASGARPRRSGFRRGGISRLSGLR